MFLFSPCGGGVLIRGLFFGVGGGGIGEKAEKGGEGGKRKNPRVS